MGRSGAAAGDLLLLIAQNIDVLAGPLVSLAYPLIPFWSYLKLVITCWLVIPQFSGATYVYQHYVRPFYTGDKTAANLWNVPSKKHNLTPISAQDDILVSGDKYTHEYRPDETIQYANVGGGVNYRGNTFFSEDDYGY